MEYFYLAVAILAFSIQFIFSKKYELMTKGGIKSGVWFSFVKGFIAVFLFLILSGFSIKITTSTIAWALMYSAATVVCSICSILAINRGSVGKVTMFLLSGGLILPFLAGVVLWDEKLGLMKIVGTLIIFSAIIIQNIGREKSKEGTFFFILCMVVFTANGLISVASKGAEISKSRVPTNNFLFVCGIFIFLISSAVLLVVHNDGFKLPRFQFRPIFIVPIVLYTAMNSTGNVFSLSAARVMDASVQFPILSAAIVVITAFLAYVFFKEKPGKKDLLSIGLNTLGILCFLFV